MFFASNTAFAQFSEFEAIAPKNNVTWPFFETKISPVNGNCEFKLEPTIDIGRKQAWLLLTSKPLTEEMQDMSEYLYKHPRLQKEASSQSDPGLAVSPPFESITPIRLFASNGNVTSVGSISGSTLEDASHNFRYSLSIPRASFKYVYVYIDYAHTIRVDKGSYYSINLGAFCIATGQRELIHKK